MTDLLENTALQQALLAGVLASIACGIMGAYVVVKRIAFISGGISHASLGGIGIALYFGVAPMAGAITVGLGSAVIIGLVSLYTREHEDTLIGALWAIGMAVGVIFIELTPDYSGGLEEFLFGDILSVTGQDLAAAAILDGVIVATVFFLYKEFLAVSLDDEFARLRGVPVAPLYVGLLCLVALAVVVLIQVVGIVLVIALLTLPAAIGRWFTHRLSSMMGMSCALGAVFTVLGISVSNFTEFPPGPCIVLIAALAYTCGLSWRKLRM